MKKTILILLLFSIYNVIIGQNSFSTIKGKVIQNSKPIEFANVIITSKEDSTKIITGTTTDSLGHFLINKIPYGKYELKIQLLGCIPRKIDITVTSSNNKIDLKTIEIKEDNKILQSVNVLAFRKSIKRTEQGFVVNANDNLIQSSGNAADLLKNMPTIMIDADGVLTIRGKTPLVLINGRVSGLTGIDRTAQLERIPASNIERIEINNNPSAKYDADADGGIINIILKTNNEAGTNGAFSVGFGYGANARLNGNLMLNHKIEKWNFGLFYNNWYTRRERNVDGERTSFNLQDEYYLTQNRFDSRLVRNQELKLTTDFSPDKKNALTFNVAWAFNGQDNNETLTNTFETQTNFFNNRKTRHSNEIRSFNAYEFELNYIKKFDRKGQVFSANIVTSFDNEQENTDIDVKNLTSDYVQIGDLNWERTKSYQLSNLATTTIDYKQPLNDFLSFETGYKNVFRYLDADFQTLSLTNGNYIINPQRSNIFKYNEQIHALYFQLNGLIGSTEQPKWKYDIGLRAEEVINSGKITDQTQDFNHQYFNLFPSANVVFYPTISDFYRLSYSRRINRPGLGDLNPFVDITDSLNQHSGNPELTPEFINSFELAYNHDWKKASLSLAAFYRKTDNVIMPYWFAIDKGAYLLKSINAGNAINYGLESVLSVNTDKFWSANLSCSVYKTEISGTVNNQEIATDIFCWYTKLINNFSLWKGCKIQFSANYTSPVAIPQGKRLEVYFMDIGLQQKIKNDRGRIGIVFTDVFNTQKSGAITSDATFYFHRVSRIDSRAILVTFAYTFGTSVHEKLMENNFKNE